MNDVCQQHDKLVSMIDQITKDIQLIKDALLGDLSNNKQGLLDEIRTLKSRVSELELFVKDVKVRTTNLVWQLITVAIIGLISGATLLKLFDKFVH